MVLVPPLLSPTSKGSWDLDSWMKYTKYFSCFIFTFGLQIYFIVNWVSLSSLFIAIGTLSSLLMIMTIEFSWKLSRGTANHAFMFMTIVFSIGKLCFFLLCNTWIFNFQQIKWHQQGIKCYLKTLGRLPLTWFYLRPPVDLPLVFNMLRLMNRDSYVCIFIANEETPYRWMTGCNSSDEAFHTTAFSSRKHFTQMCEWLSAFSAAATLLKAHQPCKNEKLASPFGRCIAVYSSLQVLCCFNFFPCHKNGLTSGYTPWTFKQNDSCNFYWPVCRINTWRYKGWNWCVLLIGWCSRK